MKPSPARMKLRSLLLLRKRKRLQYQLTYSTKRLLLEILFLKRKTPPERKRKLTRSTFIFKF
jgi:hypothetical protein